MKHFLAFAAAIATLVSVTSCDNRPNPAGEWSGTVTENVPGEQKTMDVTLAFAQDGSLMATYVITTVEDLPGNDSIVTPYQASVTASVSQSGTWQYVDGEDDEILITFDKNSIKVDIAPDKVEYRVNQLTGQESSGLEALTPALINKYSQVLRTDFAQRNGTMLMEDVDVKANMLKFEIGKHDYVFTGERAK